MRNRCRDGPGGHLTTPGAAHAEETMSKGMDRKKETKKKPQKSLAEKRAAKEAKRKSRG